MEQANFSLKDSFLYGKSSAKAIRENLECLWEAASAKQVTRSELLNLARDQKELLSANRIAEICAIAEGAKLSPEMVICLNLFHSRFMQEGCTVFFAAGKASANGCTVFGKNSDKSGNDELVGDYCYRNREINVVSYFENEDGSHIIGVSAAGTTGLKMGLNSHGVAAASNYGYTREANVRALSRQDIFASDRAQLIRNALSQQTALAAAQYAAANLLKQPMATSGMVEFADAREVYIVEGSYDRLSVQRVVDAVDSRSNYFQTMEHLNQPGNTSCFCRYHRTQELLRAISGHVTADDLKRISMDHQNGPGTNSICRHTPGFASSTLASAVMELNGEKPEKSLIHIALGKPCNAWRQPDGHITISMECARNEIPIEFLSGEIFKKYCLSDPIDD